MNDKALSESAAVASDLAHKAKAASYDFAKFLSSLQSTSTVDAPVKSKKVKATSSDEVAREKPSGASRVKAKLEKVIPAKSKAVKAKSEGKA